MRLHHAASGMLAARRIPERILPATLAQDPAWDILLHLYVLRLQRRRIDISGLCWDKPGSITTALRRIHALEEAGFVERQSDRKDGRRFFVRLREPAFRRVERALRDMLTFIGP